MAVLRGVESAGQANTAIRLYNDVVQRGRTETITEKDFSSEEQKSLKNFILSHAEKTGKQDGHIDYKDYPPGVLSDSVGNTLGGFNYSVKDGVVNIEDTYDFNANRADKFDNEWWAQYLGLIANPRGLAANVGRKIIPDTSGKGVPVKLELK